RKDWKPRESSSGSKAPRAGGKQRSQSSYHGERGGKPGYHKTGTGYRAGNQNQDSRPRKKTKPRGTGGTSSDERA
ncbi:MAG TPA: hypothetical protein PK137_06050, partial [Anaerolineaceae bacterium]|nr:hypothetical protein [Anaerolineaceae bacterium]